ncbi:MAG: hypothetical protein JST89_13825 [Cyanobacteria bacterium SZAS-4]|nr:hypothetical protein [Cyanobacteria bacterium SZAS-4]
MTACGGAKTSDTSNLPPIDDSRNGQQTSTVRTTTPAHHGMSNGQKAVLLVGAAALYYMYKKNQEARQAGKTSEPQYYLSKNGRVYYRERGGRVHWVTPPAGGVQVSPAEASQYEQYQGYEGRDSGRDLIGITSTQ